MNSHKAIIKRFREKFCYANGDFWGICLNDSDGSFQKLEDFWLKEVEKAYDAGYEKRQQEVHDLFNSKD